jgi:hypothetical protein
MDKSRLPYGGSRIGRSDLGGEHTCGPAHAAMTAASQRAPDCNRCTGFAERRPGPNEGQADVVEEETGRGTARAAGVGVPARRNRYAELTSGRSFSQQGLTATCLDRVFRVRPRHKEGGGLAHEPVGAMKAGQHRLTWSTEPMMSEVTPHSCKGALGTWQLQEYPDIVGPAHNEAPVEANHRELGCR